MAEDDFSEGRPKPVIPRFFMDKKQHNFRSEQEGRPVFIDVEMVECIIPGDRMSKPTYEVTEEHRARWPRAYEAFKAGQEAPLEGTPLREWPLMTRALVENYATFNVRTVEQLAALGDNHIQNLGMGAREFRAKAQRFLDVAKNGTAPLERMAAKIAGFEQSDRLKDETIASLQAQIDELRAGQSAPRGKKHVGA